MRITLAPVAVHPGERSRNLASAHAAVALAAEQDPAPDLIVLPACSGLISTPDSGAMTLSRGMCQGFAQSLAALAREWGCWLACGHSVMSQGAPVAGSSLFDPDGDTFIREPRMAPRNGAWGGLSTMEAGLAVETPLGSMIVAPGETAEEWTPPQAGDVHVELIVAVCCGALTPSGRNALTGLATAHGAALCIAGPSQSQSAMASEIMDSSGRMLVRVDAHRPKPVAVELSMGVRYAPATSSIKGAAES